MSDMEEFVAKAIAKWDSFRWDEECVHQSKLRALYKEQASVAIKAMDQWRFEAAGISTVSSAYRKESK